MDISSTRHHRFEMEYNTAQNKSRYHLLLFLKTLVIKNMYYD